MNTLHISVADTINGRAADIYNTLADYHIGHPAVLPKPYFAQLVVKEGGQGAGTRTRVDMEVLGVKKSLHHVISEPEPGRVLMETDEETGLTTVFTIDPVGDGTQSHLTIASDIAVRGGVLGAVEKMITAPITRRIFAEEIKNIEAYVSELVPA